MKITQKNLEAFISFLVLFIIIGTLVWEIFELLLSYAGFGIHLAVGPVGFDIRVLSVYIMLNPGSPAGAAAGYLLFKRI